MSSIFLLNQEQLISVAKYQHAGIARRGRPRKYFGSHCPEKRAWKYFG